MQHDAPHPEPDLPAWRLPALWHRLRCARCRNARREVRRLRRSLAALPDPPQSDEGRQRLLQAFRTRHGARRPAAFAVVRAAERLAGGHRGRSVVAAALLVALVPALPPLAQTGPVGDLLGCCSILVAAGLALAVGMYLCARGRLTRGPLLACAAIGALLAAFVLSTQEPACRAAPHILAAHAPGILIASACALLLRPRIRFG